MQPAQKVRTGNQIRARVDLPVKGLGLGGPEYQASPTLTVTWNPPQPPRTQDTELPVPLHLRLPPLPCTELAATPTLPAPVAPTPTAPTGLPADRLTHCSVLVMFQLIQSPTPLSASITSSTKWGSA